ncbi:hypothetical protein D7S86_07875 [Pararobbsia silviterrae]|uniref:Uncharacterized protein n=2 Tax=Pararobbsia silviterrae TaxID=1792498 RepID=A0A494Y5B4_9BURK|nr:hypothetical protein D7S86_07875 [Pararobbsia silviterrae]
MDVRHIRDEAREAAQRSAFMDRWQYHYLAMKSLAPSLTVRRLTLLVRIADVANLWSYPALVQHDLPYVLLALAGFIRDRDSSGEVCWVRFCFDGAVRDVSDLWREAAHVSRFFRMVYRPPIGTPFPTSRELVRFETVERTLGFTNQADPIASIEDSDEFDCALIRRDEKTDGGSMRVSI